MKGIDLLNSMELVDDKYIEEAAYHVKVKTINIYYYISLAASLVMAVLSGGWVLLDLKRPRPAHHISGGVATTMSKNADFAFILFVVSLAVVIAIIAAICVKTYKANHYEE